MRRYSHVSESPRLRFPSSPLLPLLSRFPAQFAGGGVYCGIGCWGAYCGGGAPCGAYCDEDDCGPDGAYAGCW